MVMFQTSPKKIGLSNGWPIPLQGSRSDTAEILQLDTTQAKLLAHVRFADNQYMQPLKLSVEL